MVNSIRKLLIHHYKIYQNISVIVSVRTKAVKLYLRIYDKYLTQTFIK